ncbi:hypothetical protein [Polluticaenibacter yanchengensis]|uniref:Uncharacterized protein n=1 Tax=Polluticaenibacter yanchengensis TaxID=3014562 RepID=A0ABT4UGG3_9BACT|nr:hypothetical protein [Chitinophagaceae bacterium LY-5]
MKLLLFIALLFVLMGCAQSDSNDGFKRLDFGKFTIEVPPSWQKLNEIGIDSDVGGIITDHSDTLRFDLGWYSNKLTEDEPVIIERSELENLYDGRDTGGFIIVEDMQHINAGDYLRNLIVWDTIDGRKAKIVYPKKSGNGLTGIYIDSLWIAGSGIDRFNMYGNHLKPENEKLFLDAIKTLKFYKKR